MRLFIAIQLSGEIKKDITETLHGLKQAGVKGNYVPLQNLHLTLTIIEKTDQPGKVKEALKDISLKPFRLTLSDLGTFGDLLYVSAKGNQGLSSAAKAVRDALDTAGISYSKDKFTPHITLIRKLAGNWKQVPPPKGEMMVKQISLMKSTFKDGKPVYSEVCSF